MRNRWNILGAALVVPALSVVSCGGDEEAELTPYERFFDEYVDALCGALEPCCTFTTYSVDECRSLMSFLATYEASAARENRFVFHADRAKQCLADLREQGICSGIAPASCDTVAEGKLAGGEACKSNVECPASERAAAVCRLTDDQQGFCLFPGRVAARGEACAGDCSGDFECSAAEPGMDAFCYADTGLRCENGTCVDRAPVGAPCSGFDDCVATATCSNAICRGLSGPAAPCVASGDCLPDLYCASGACAARLPAGSACDAAPDSCLDACINGRCASFALETLCLFGSTE
jgi:hypothetical protein